MAKNQKFIYLPLYGSEVGNAELEGLVCHPQQAAPTSGSKADLFALSQLVGSRGHEGRLASWTHHFHTHPELKHGHTWS